MRTKACLLMILLCLSPVVAYAQNQNDALIQALYVKSGLEKQVEQVPLLIRAGLDQEVLENDRIKRMPRKAIAAISGALQEAFAPDSLKKTILGEVRENLTIEDVTKVLEWLDSPIGRKCTQLEEAASTPEALVEIQQYAAQLQNSTPTADRLRILRKLDSALKATETNVEIAINIQLGVAAAIIALLPLEQQRPLADIPAEIEKNRPHIEAVMRQQTLVFLLYAYRSITNAELERYIEFATSPTGSKYHVVAISGLKKALLDGSIKWGEAIANILKQLASQPEV